MADRHAKIYNERRTDRQTDKQAKDRKQPKQIYNDIQRREDRQADRQEQSQIHADTEMKMTHNDWVRNDASTYKVIFKQGA